MGGELLDGKVDQVTAEQELQLYERVEACQGRLAAGDGALDGHLQIPVGASQVQEVRTGGGGGVLLRPRGHQVVVAVVRSLDLDREVGRALGVLEAYRDEFGGQCLQRVEHTETVGHRSVPLPQPVARATGRERGDVLDVQHEREEAVCPRVRIRQVVESQDYVLVPGGSRS